MSDLFARLVRAGDTVIDVGANIGIHTLRLAQIVGREGEVIALEASSALVARLTSNLEINAVSNVRVIHRAAADTSGLTLMLQSPPVTDRNRGRSSLVSQPHLAGGPIEETISVTLDELSADKPIRLVKIDVEGAEATVLSGATELLKRNEVYIVFEHDGRLTGQSTAAIDQLRSYDYNIQALYPRRAGLRGRTHLELRPFSDCRAGVNLLASPNNSA